MLKADATRFENLAAIDESVQLEAAVQLEGLKSFHFHHHPVGKFSFSPEQVARLVSNWHTTTHPLVKVWIAQALALTENDSPEALAIFPEVLNFDGAYMPAVAEFLRRYRTKTPNGNELFKSLHRHPNPEVRRYSAISMGSMVHEKTLNYASDMPILHAMMLDVDPSVRFCAVTAVEYMLSELGPADYEVFLDVANIDSGNARHYAKEFMAKLEKTTPGCTPSAFTPREPLLRTDGVYRIAKSELDADGVWVSSGCLRFFSDTTVHYFGTNEAPVDFAKRLAALKPKIVSGKAEKHGAKVTITWENGDLHEGELDGAELKLQNRNRTESRPTGGTYAWTHVDWEASPAEPPVPAKQAKPKKKAALPFIPANPASMTISDATKWYVQMLARLPSMLEGIQDESEKVVQAWRLKNDLRDSAAKAMYDPALKKRFFSKLPILPLEELQKQAPAAALSTLFTVTQAEVRAFPGTIGESIGLEYWDGKQTWVMTETGWALKTN